MTVASGEIVPKLRCLRCGHRWVPRKTLDPTVCPQCKSPYWNKQKQEGK